MMFCSLPKEGCRVKLVDSLPGMWRHCCVVLDLEMCCSINSLVFTDHISSHINDELHDIPHGRERIKLYYELKLIMTKLNKKGRNQKSSMKKQRGRKLQTSRGNTCTESGVHHGKEKKR